MPEFSGTVAEIGGKEMSKDGTKEKPRKVVIKDDPSKQFGKTFRVWPNSGDFDVLREAAESGALVAVEYEVNQIPGTDYTQNMIVNVSDGAGLPPNGSGQAGSSSSAPSDQSWGEPPPDAWSGVSTSPSTHYDDTQNQIVASWAIKCAIQTLGVNADPDTVHSRAHELIVLKERIAKELSK